MKKWLQILQRKVLVLVTLSILLTSCGTLQIEIFNNSKSPTEETTQPSKAPTGLATEQSDRPTQDPGTAGTSMELGDLTRDLPPGEIIRLTSSSALEDYAAWSPDGRWMAFMSEEDGTQDLFVMDLLCLANQYECDDSILQLTQDGSSKRAPAWSPDGLQLAYSVSGSGFEDIYLLDLSCLQMIPEDWDRSSQDGYARVLSGCALQPEVFIDHFEYNNFPSWSPDGTGLSFDGKDGYGGDVYLFNLDDPQTFTPLLERHGRFYWAVMPTWSPDGQQIAYIVHNDSEMVLVVDDLVNNTLRVRTTGFSRDLLPRWSPDGEWIVYEHNGLIWKISPDCIGSEEEIGLIPERCQQQPIQITHDDGRFQWTMGANWSPDSQVIVFSARAGDNTDLYLLREDSSQAALEITPTIESVEDLPEGIIFGYEGQIWKSESDGSVNALAEWPVEEYVYGKDLSSDGRNFVYATLAGGTSDIFHVDLHSGEVRNLTQTPSRVEYCPVWWSDEARGILFTYLEEAGFPEPWCANDYAIVNLDGQYTDEDWDTDQLEVKLPERGEPMVIMRSMKAWVYRTDGSLSVIQPEDFGLEVGKVFMASLSPEGDRVAMVISTPSTEEAEIQYVILDLTTVTSQILDSYEACECAPLWYPPTWSPDESWVLFEGDGRFILYRTDGLDQINVNGDGNPAWSPDSRYFAYNKDQRIFILDMTNWNVTDYPDMEGALLLGWRID